MRIIVLILVFFPLVMHGQDISKQLEQTRKYYEGTRIFTSEVAVTAWNKERDLVMNEKAVLKKKDKYFWYVVGETKMLVGEKEVLILNEGEKDLVYREVSPKEYSEYVRNFQGMRNDSLLRSYDSIRYEGNKEGMNHYVLYRSKGSISYADFYFDDVTGAYRKVKYTYKEQYWKQVKNVEINFLNKESLSDADLNLFSTGKYIQKNKNQITLTPAFSRFNLIIANDEEIF